eukprot:3981377-Prymnesium_polylepis.2
MADVVNVIANLQCPAGHALVRILDEDIACEDVLMCDQGCGNPLRPGQPRWSCDDCDWDMCHSCAMLETRMGQKKRRRASQSSAPVMPACCSPCVSVPSLPALDAASVSKAIDDAFLPLPQLSAQQSDGAPSSAAGSSAACSSAAVSSHALPGAGPAGVSGSLRPDALPAHPVVIQTPPPRFAAQQPVPRAHSDLMHAPALAAPAHPMMQPAPPPCGAHRARLQSAPPVMTVQEAMPLARPVMLQASPLAAPPVVVQAAPPPTHLVTVQALSLIHISEPTRRS